MLGIFASAFCIYFGLMIFIKVNGLRSFSKMSGHDFAVTVAIGSVFASTIVSKDPSIAQGLMAIASMLIIQSAFSYWRLKRSKPYMENEPLLLMHGSEILYDNLKKVKMTKTDLIAKLREANVLDLSEVKAAVLEQTGDVSILHGSKNLDSVFVGEHQKAFRLETGFQRSYWRLFVCRLPGVPYCEISDIGRNPSPAGEQILFFFLLPAPWMF